MNKFERYWRTFIYRLFPDYFWKPYARFSKSLGIEKPFLILSFDCDTDEDIIAAKKIHDWLGERNSKGVFAVPGTQLRKGKNEFRQMSKEGACFINHGGAAHAKYEGGRYWSVNFYNQMSHKEIKADIKLGHSLLLEVIGREPKGFRAPHFGHFQKKSQLSFLYSYLIELGYKFASTTTPIFLLKNGPVIKYTNYFKEIPVSGLYRYPLRLFDSWSYVQSPYNPQITQRYQSDFENLIKNVVTKGIPVVLNHYVDPSHVADSHYFYDAIQYAIDFGVQIISYSELLKKINEN